MRASEFTQPQSAGCIVVAKDTGRWCLQQRSDTVSDPGLWAAWGGGVEPGETLEQCVRRELAEESGYRGPIKLEPLAKNAKYATYIGIVPHEFEPHLNSESQDSCWVHAGDWPSPLHPGLRSALSRLDQGVAEGSIKDLQYDLQDQQWDAIVGYVINGLKKNMDIGRMELNLYKYAGQEMFDVDQELQDRGFKDIADLADHIKQHNGRYVPPTDFGLSDLGKGVAEGLNEADASTVQFRTASTDNYQSSFTVTAIADGKTVGHFSFFRDPETDEVHNQAEVTDDVRGKGYGKALLLKAIEVANDHGLGFQEDSQSLSRAQSRVYDSLYDAGWIVDADGYWFLTPEGEQELSRLSTVQQGVAEGAESQYIAARYIDEFGDGDHWYVKGNPDVIKKFVLLANSLEDEAVKGTEYEPDKGMMAKVHGQLGDDSIPQWQIVQAQNLEQLKPIGNRVLQLLMQPDLSHSTQEFMSEFLWTLEEKGLALVTGEPEQGVAEGKDSGYREIEFICVNPKFPEATDPELQKQMFQQLKNIPGVIPLFQGWDDYSQGQMSLSAIYKDRAARGQILGLAKRLGVKVDLEQSVSDEYVDRAIRGEHEGQQGVAENFADGQVKGRSRPGRVKRAGASCEGSVSDLRARARKYSGERARMYHWCANMKSGRKK